MGNIFLKSAAAFFLAALIACNNNTNDDCAWDNCNNPGSSNSGGGGGNSSDDNKPNQSNLVLPSIANQEAANSLYRQWKNIYFRTAQQDIDAGEVNPDVISLFVDNNAGMARIRHDKTASGACATEGICTVSEGIGYAMIMSYFQGERDDFERLWRYAVAYSYDVAGKYLMDWKTNSFLYGSIAKGSATDADLDIATALYLGYRKWGDEGMLDYAKKVANDIWEFEIEKNNLLILPGNSGWPGRGEYNPSYFSPVAFRIFAEIDGGHDWNGVLNRNYEWMENMSAKGNLFPDWADANGEPVKPFTGVANSSYKQYYLESVRVPWRLAWDYAWYGDQRAKTILDRMAEFTINDCEGDPSKIRERYDFYGAQNYSKGSGKMPQKASLCATGLANSSRAGWLNACTAAVNETSISGFNYFPHILQVMYAQLLNGKYGGRPF